MPREVNFEGASYQFPDDATDEEIFGFLDRNTEQSVSAEGEAAPTLHGEDAIKRVEEKEGIKLDPMQRRVVELEGFVDGVYEDSKGIKTSGVGQTGDYMNATFQESFDEHLNTTKRLVKGFDNYPEYLKAELVQAAYRGDLQQSKNFRRLLNAGDYEGAALEMLDHQEYLAKDTPRQIKKRLESVADAVAKYGREVGDTMLASVDNNTKTVG